MAIAVQLDFAGATLDQYDAVNKTIGPASAVAGLPAPPGIQFFEVHSYSTAG